MFDLARGDPEPLKGSEGLWSSQWSPDGRYIVALTIVGQKLMLFDVPENEWRPLGVSHANHPTWSRDSRFVYCDPEGSEHTFRKVRIADGHVETLVDLKDHIVAWGGVGRDDTPLLLLVRSNIYAIELDRG